MKSDLTNIPEMLRETRDRALEYANAVNYAEHTEENDHWMTAAQLAWDAQDAALKTINSALMKTCTTYSNEHAAAGYIDEDDPGPTLYKHNCPKCLPLTALAKSITEVFGRLRANHTDEEDMVSGEVGREIHSGVIGQVYLAAFMASRQVRLNQDFQAKFSEPGFLSQVF